MKVLLDKLEEIIPLIVDKSQILVNANLEKQKFLLLHIYICIYIFIYIYIHIFIYIFITKVLNIRMIKK